MADKMKQQQKLQQEEAQRTALRNAEQKKAKNLTFERRTTRSRATKEETTDNPENKITAKGKKASTNGRPKREAKINSISSYFKKAEVTITEENPTVQEALKQAADEFETKPTALGEQTLVATQQPTLVTGGTMREYQLEGLEWLKSLWMNGLCGILADEMGLGKTVQALSLIAFFKEQNISGPFLIAAPLSTLSNWIDEFGRWAPSIRTVLYHGTKEERAELRRNYMKIQDQKSMDFPVICTSYEICINDRKFLSQYQWKYIIVVSQTKYL
jgi:ATP-dependent DNA helicase